MRFVFHLKQINFLAASLNSLISNCIFRAVEQNSGRVHFKSGHRDNLKLCLLRCWKYAALYGGREESRVGLETGIPLWNISLVLDHFEAPLEKLISVADTCVAL